MSTNCVCDVLNPWCCSVHQDKQKRTAPFNPGEYVIVHGYDSMGNFWPEITAMVVSTVADSFKVFIRCNDAFTYPSHLIVYAAVHERQCQLRLDMT